MHSRSSTTMRVKMALWFLPFSLGLRPKQVYWPASSKVMFHNRMETLFLWFFPTNSTLSLNIFTSGSTSSEAISASHTWQDQQQAVSHPTIPPTSYSKQIGNLSGKLLPSSWCHCHWIASWNKGFRCRYSWHTSRVTWRCFHSLPPGREPSQQASPDHEQTTHLRKRSNRL